MSIQLEGNFYFVHYFTTLLMCNFKWAIAIATMTDPTNYFTLYWSNRLIR